MYKTIKNVALATLVGGSILLTGCMRTVGVHVRTDSLYCSSVGYEVRPIRPYHVVRPTVYTVLPRPTLDLRIGCNPGPLLRRYVGRRLVPVHRPRYEPKQRPQRPRQMQQARQRQPFPQPRRPGRR